MASPPARVTLLLTAMFLAGVTRLTAQKARVVDPQCLRVLPAAEANRLSGRSDLQLVPRLSITAAGGTCNYAADGKKMVFLFTLLNEKGRAAEAYTRYRSQAPYLPHQAEVRGLGDAAFTGGEPEHLLVVRQGTTVVQVASMLELERPTNQMHARVSLPQLVALARAVVAKL